MKRVADIPKPTLIGYFAKPTRLRTDWPKTAAVEEIGSAANCMSRLANDWVDEWRHNEMWVFDSPELAWGVVSVELLSKCDLYAYRLFPFSYVGGEKQSFQIPAVNAVQMDGTFEKLGYDLVSRTCGNIFEHSPLSCNALADEVPINRYCLLETAEEAFALAPTLEVPGQPMRGEPGPYFIVEVWRQRRELTPSSVG